MRKALFAASLGGSLLISACATLIPRSQPGAELVGQTLRLQTARGQASTMHFMRGGAVRAVFGEREVLGRWELEQGNLCFFWTGAPRECWRYTAPFRRGRT